MVSVVGSGEARDGVGGTGEGGEEEKGKKEKREAENHFFCAGYFLAQGNFSLMSCTRLSTFVEV